MSFTKFFDLIDRSFVGAIVRRKAELIEKTDPNRIWVENVRAFFGVPTGTARHFCEVAVREGAFVKKRALLCGNEDCRRVILSGDPDDPLPPTIECENCRDLEREPSSFLAADLPTMDFYQLNAPELPARS